MYFSKPRAIKIKNKIQNSELTAQDLGRYYQIMTCGSSLKKKYGQIIPRFGLGSIDFLRLREWLFEVRTEQWGLTAITHPGLTGQGRGRQCCSGEAAIARRCLQRGRTQAGSTTLEHENRGMYTHVSALRRSLPPAAGPGETGTSSFKCERSV